MLRETLCSVTRQNPVCATRYEQLPAFLLCWAPSSHFLFLPILGYLLFKTQALNLGSILQPPGWALQWNQRLGLCVPSCCPLLLYLAHQHGALLWYLTKAVMLKLQSSRAWELLVGTTHVPPSPGIFKRCPRWFHLSMDSQWLLFQPFT